MALPDGRDDPDDRRAGAFAFRAALRAAGRRTAFAFLEAFLTDFDVLLDAVRDGRARFRAAALALLRAVFLVRFAGVDLRLLAARALRLAIAVSFPSLQGRLP